MIKWNIGWLRELIWNTSLSWDHSPPPSILPLLKVERRPFRISHSVSPSLPSFGNLVLLLIYVTNLSIELFTISSSLLVRSYCLLSYYIWKLLSQLSNYSMFLKGREVRIWRALLCSTYDHHHCLPPPPPPPLLATTTTTTTSLSPSTWRPRQAQTWGSCFAQTCDVKREEEGQTFLRPSMDDSSDDEW